MQKEGRKCLMLLLGECVHQQLSASAFDQHLQLLGGLKESLSFELHALYRLETFLSFQKKADGMRLVVFEGDDMVAGTVIKDVVAQSQVIGSD